MIFGGECLLSIMKGFEVKLEFGKVFEVLLGLVVEVIMVVDLLIV